ncbi:MAG: hypothetical protein AB7G15_11745 [Alphaproteobacteria bacterium]
MRAPLARIARLQPRIAAWSAVALFGAALALPMAAQVFGAKAEFGLLELRRLASAPEIPRNTTAWLRLPAAMDLYLRDHFGLRPHLVNLHLWLGRKLGVSHTHNVLIGKRGWLFFRGDKVIEQYQGTDRFAEAELERWIDAMAANRRWLERRGVPLLVVIAPDPHGIYAEQLPDHIERVDAGRLDQLVARLAQRPAFDFVDLRPALLAAKAREQVYFKTDTHWNTRGAYAAYRAIVDRLRSRFPDMPVLREDDLIRTERRAVYGLGRMLAPRGGIAEDDIELTPRAALTVGPVQTAPPPPRTHGQTPYIATTVNRAAPRVLVIGDSYFGYMYRFFHGSFAKLTWLRHGFVYFPAAEIPDDRYDIAIFIMVQRGLRYRLRGPGQP